MKKRVINKLIISQDSGPIIVDLDSIDKKESVEKNLSDVVNRDPRELLFSMFLREYIRVQAKEFLISRQKSGYYQVFNLMEDGSKQELFPPPNYLIPEIIKSFKKWGIMDYNPDLKEQCGSLNARYKGKDNLLELCVRQSQYGREIVVRKPTKESLREAV